jgi:hypothetical protein
MANNVVLVTHGNQQIVNNAHVAEVQLDVARKCFG